MDKETSPHVSSIAAKVLNLELFDLPAECQNCDTIRVLLRDAKTLAGSCMSQDETPGQEKAPDDFFTRLKNERDDLDGRLSKLALYLGNGAPGTTPRHREMLNEQSRLMSDLLVVLDERIADIEISKRSDTSGDETENNHAE